mmetsp:Transcript_43090/g.69415  ORF Transcript_43090/g.69415 Transcript_43090/m.69415 type:complete len:304 (+) Transcript_43090:233-1144(+)
MNLIYGKNPFPEDERMEYRRSITANVIDSIQTLIDMAEVYAEDMPFQKKDQHAIRELEDLDSTLDDIDEERAALIKYVWKLPQIQKTYEHRSNYYITDSAAFYFDCVDTIGKPGYVPTVEHILRTRARTIGVVQKMFEIKGNIFQIFDVGGQRNERKKWIHFFDDVTCVIFVAAISAYDTVLFEDHKQNRLVEALDLFDEICNIKYFEKTTMILMLNKRDIFEEKVSKIPITVCPALRQYNGPMEFLPCADYIQQMFYERNQKERDIKMHITTATDQENMIVVFEAVKETVIRGSLRAAGLEW